MDSRARLLCLPRGSFYPLSSVHSMLHRRITKTNFRSSFTRQCHCQAGLCLYTLCTMSIRAKPTFVPLRYLLARYRPSKTAHLAISPNQYSWFLGKTCHTPKRGVTLSSRQRRDSLLHLTVRVHSSMPNYSKAPR